MYRLTIKDSSPDLLVMVTRSIMIMAGIASVFFSSGAEYFISIGSAVLLLLAALFVKMILYRFKYGFGALLGLAALLMFFATGSVSFAVVLIMVGIAISLIDTKAEVEILPEGVSIKKIFSKPLYHWNCFNNVILKDNLLTLDFTSNKLLQLTIDDTKSEIDEQKFNAFCTLHLSGGENNFSE